jgi:hypothetical protein
MRRVAAKGGSTRWNVDEALDHRHRGTGGERLEAVGTDSRGLAACSRSSRTCSGERWPWSARSLRFRRTSAPEAWRRKPSDQSIVVRNLYSRPSICLQENHWTTDGILQPKGSQEANKVGSIKGCLLLAKADAGLLCPIIFVRQRQRHLRLSRDRDALDSRRRRDRKRSSPPG